MIFLSHSGQNKTTARRVVEALTRERLPCWYDEQQIVLGSELRASIRSAISRCDIYIYLVSHAANESRWVHEELQYALNLEFNDQLKIVPVLLDNNSDEMPELLSGRVYTTLDSKLGGVAGLAHQLSKIDGCRNIRDDCYTSATVRLDRLRVEHTLKQAHECSDSSKVSVLLLDDQYRLLDHRYWEVAELDFPVMEADSREVALAASETFADLHRQSRSIIGEAQVICCRALSIDCSEDERIYHEAACERILYVILHRLQWNTTYFHKIRDGNRLSEGFVALRRLPEPFDGDRFDFVVDGTKLGSAKLPPHSHPRYPHVKKPIAWGLSHPFTTTFPSDVGIAVGDILARRFLARSIPSTKIPPSSSLKFGLS